MKTMLYINKQIEAEKDTYLIDCFYDSGIIKKLIDEKYTVLMGRKGAGKSAVAQYLEKKHKDFDIDFVTRISIRNFNTNSDSSSNSEKSILESILNFVIVTTVKRLMNEGIIKGDKQEFWNDFFKDNGLQAANDYESFSASRKITKRKYNITALVSNIFAKVTGEGGLEKQREEARLPIANTPGNLFSSLCKSLYGKKEIIIFIDDISDHLDKSAKNNITRDIKIIQEFLLNMQSFNQDFAENGLNIRIVSLVREDLFEFMEGSNTGKIKNDSLEIVWKEKDFASMLIKRMSVFDDKREECLVDPVLSLKEWFPDEIFSERLETFDINRHGCNFYAYMVAISFNRPRDYLQFCYALNSRLSVRHPATSKNIDAAEIEYSDYLQQELRDELYLASRVIDCDFTEGGIESLVNKMIEKESFGYSELKVKLSHMVSGRKGKAGHRKIQLLLSELWRYGVIGIQEKDDVIIKFKYLSGTVVFIKEKSKKYKYYLHRGLWWFARKRHKK